MVLELKNEPKHCLRMTFHVRSLSSYLENVLGAKIKFGENVKS